MDKMMPEPEEVDCGVSNPVNMEEEGSKTEVTTLDVRAVDDISKDDTAGCQGKTCIRKLQSDGYSTFLETGGAVSDDSDFFSMARSLTFSESEVEGDCNVGGGQCNSEGNAHESFDSEEGELSQSRKTRPTGTPSNQDDEAMLCTSPRCSNAPKMRQELYGVDTLEAHEDSAYLKEGPCFVQSLSNTSGPLLAQNGVTGVCCCHTSVEERLGSSDMEGLSSSEPDAKKRLDGGRSDKSFRNVVWEAVMRNDFQEVDLRARLADTTGHGVHFGRMKCKPGVRRPDVGEEGAVYRLSSCNPLGHYELCTECECSSLQIKDLPADVGNWRGGDSPAKESAWLSYFQGWTDTCKSFRFSELKGHGLLAAKGLWKSSAVAAESCLSALSVHSTSQCRTLWTKAKSRIASKRGGFAVGNESSRAPILDPRNCTGLEEKGSWTGSGVKFIACALEYHRRLLAIYGDILEDVMRLVLQVMPVHSSGVISAVYVETKLQCYLCLAAMEAGQCHRKQ